MTQSGPPPPSPLGLLHGFSYPAAEGGIDVAEDYHESSKIYPALAAQGMGPASQFIADQPAGSFSLGRKALVFAGEHLALTTPSALPVDLAQLTWARRSVLPADAAPVGLDQLGTVLGLCAGRHPERPGLRVVPSAGAMYPLDLAVIAHRVAGLGRGAYAYDPIAHALCPLAPVDPDTFHSAATQGLRSAAQPAVTLAIIATFARTRAKYGLRGYRFCLLEAGHTAHAALLVATALGLATLPWGGFADAAVDDLLELDGRQRSCVYLVAVSGSGDAGDGE
jgi:SagB-type dehydrogenase family enzyme